MKPPTIGKQFAAFPIADIVADLLHGYEEVPISNSTAEVLFLVCKNKVLCHVQYPGHGEVDITGKLITQPHLWAIERWQDSSEKWLRARAWSEKQRDERLVFEANIRKVQRAILKMAMISPEFATVLAHRMVKKNEMDKITALGVRLFTNVKEI